MKISHLLFAALATVTALNCQAGEKGEVALSAGLGYGWYDLDDETSDSFVGAVQFGYYATRTFEWKAGVTFLEPEVNEDAEDAFEASFGFRYYNVEPQAFDAYIGVSVSYLDLDIPEGESDDIGALFEVGFLQPLSDRISLDYSFKYRYYNSFELDAYSATASVVFSF